MKYSQEISCSKDNLRLIRDFIKETLTIHAIPENEIHSMVLAMDEMCANLIIHSHHCNIAESFEIQIIISKRAGVTFKILDENEMFDLLNYESPSLDELVKTQRKGGIGLILVKKIMDEITFRSENGKNCCCLFKKVEVQ